MKRLLLVCLVVLLAVGLTTAGERMTKQGTHSLNFLINGLGDFGVNGFPAAMVAGGTMYGFGGSYFMNDDMAIRTGIAFNRWNQNSTVPTGEFDDTEFGFGISPALLWYCLGEGAVSGYWGPTATFGMFSDESKFTPTTGTGTSTKQSWTQFAFGVVLGAQWWAWDQVAFNAEYVVAYSSASSEVESGGTTVDGPTVTEFGIYEWSVGLGLFFNR